MLKHLVLIRFTPEASENARTELVKALRTLPDKIPNIVALEVGANVVEAARNFDLGLVVDFPSREALDHYATHPAHQAVVQERILPILDQIAVVDFDC